MIRLSAASGRIVAWWDSAAVRFNPIAVIVVVWALLALPLVVFRGYNADDGVAVTIARSALEDGHWLTPHLFNLRFIERPTLLSWIIAAISAPFGEVSQITARLPTALFLLGGCLLIHGVLRKVASPAAALFGAALFLAGPLVFRFYVQATADLPLAVLLFLAFVLWWNGYAAGPTSLGRWVAVGVALALAGLMKGPQPIAYFAFGVGLFLLGARAFREIPGLVLAGIVCVLPLAGWYWYVFATGDEAQWAAFMRLHPAALLPGPLHSAPSLLANTIPAIMLAGAFLAGGGLRGNDRAPAALVRALTCYASVATLAILFWPGGSAGRYFLPMVPPVCVLGGLAYDALGKRWPQLVALGVVMALTVLVYATALSVIAAPLLPRQFRQTRIDAARVTELVRAQPAPLYRTGDTALNVLPYVPGRIANIELNELETMPGPAWIAVPAAQAAMLMAKRPNAFRVAAEFGRAGDWKLLRLGGR